MNTQDNVCLAFPKAIASEGSSSDGHAGVFRVNRILNSAQLRQSINTQPYRDEESWQLCVPMRFKYLEAFRWPSPDPTLPNVLLIGDSISIQYTAGVRKRLTGMANVFRAPNNCRSTRQTLEEIDTYLGRKEWDIIHFNWGIHEVTRINDQGEPDPEGNPQVSLKTYRRNLQRLVRRLKATGAISNGLLYNFLQ